MPLGVVLEQKRIQARQWLTAGNKDWWIFAPLLTLFGVGAVFDIWLVDTGHSSITNTVTQQCITHPTLIAFGWMLGFGLARVVKRYQWMVMVVWVLVGHLFTGMVVG
jgi:hypothetical protein